ncbi:hypothetical protein MSG28_013922 [Choristoneura fumiferana]|uniref:Uncharacterized protein n=1 Tax=Choristoneura fumiferana TaxID=7141 RepID=A0ACC0K9J9_CHOFU|nr:hypothetical protein MSG28_013922 [Choristoneura fumiferana]
MSTSIIANKAFCRTIQTEVSFIIHNSGVGKLPPGPARVAVPGHRRGARQRGPARHVAGVALAAGQHPAVGGDAARVALAGRSAGAYAAHTLALSPAAAPLFRALVGSDGTALIEKNLMTYPVTVARNYAKKLGFDSDDVEELAKFYREAPVDQLLNQSLNFVNMDDGELGFGVCVERPVPGVERLVPRAPALLLPANARPALFTYCDDESSIKAADLVKKNREYNENFPIFMPANLDFPSDEIKYAVSNETRSFYFGNGTITAASRAAFGDFWADRQYVYQAAYCAAEQAARAPAFLLEFTYEGGLSEKKPEPAARGAGHPDFFNYLMPPKEVDDEDDLRIVKEITTIVADFVKTGICAFSISTVGPACGRPPKPIRYRLTRMVAGGGAGPESGVGAARGPRPRGADAAPRRSALPPALALWHRLYSRYRRTNYWPLTDPAAG